MVVWVQCRRTLKASTGRVLRCGSSVMRHLPHAAARFLKRYGHDHLLTLDDDVVIGWLRRELPP